MSHCHCEEMERRFDIQRVRRELTAYHRHGAASATRLLIEALQAESIEGMTLLDIGGGIGAIQHALVPAGVSQALDVDASAAYIAAAREEAERRGLAECIRFVHGNFVELASTIPPADLVTLDRVICCFNDMPALVSLSAARAQQLYGVVFPHDTWRRRLFNQVRHVMLALARLPIHFYVYRADAIDAVVRAQGLERRFSCVVDRWQVVIYVRSSPFTANASRKASSAGEERAELPGNPALLTIEAGAIYKVVMVETPSRAVCPGTFLPVLMICVKCSYFSGNCAQCSTELPPMIECCVQGSIHPEAARVGTSAQGSSIFWPKGESFCEGSNTTALHRLRQNAANACRVASRARS